jgi:hypothetical protein
MKLRHFGALLSLVVLGIGTHGCKSEVRRFDALDESGGGAGEASSAPTGSGGTGGAGSAGSTSGGTAGGASECSDGEAECVRGEASARVCRDGTWKTTACEGDTPLCAEGRCVSCEPGAEQCRDDVAHRCDEDGSWESLNACTGNEIECPNCTLGQECADETDCGTGYCLDHECVECEPETRDCVGLTPRLCSNDGTWVNQPPCAGELSLCDPDTGVCVCEEDDHSCVDKDNELRCEDGAWQNNACRAGCLTGQGVDACRTDTVATPGVVACDPATNTTCDISAGNVCCLAQDYVSQHTCTAAPNCPNTPPNQQGNVSSAMRHRCDAADDCPSGQSCCFLEYTYTETYCTANVSDCLFVGGPLLRVVCDPDGAACPDGKICKPRRFPNSMMVNEVGFYTCEDP